MSPARPRASLRRAASALALSACVAVAGRASADLDPAGKEAVLRLYNEGKALVEAGQLAEGCARFERGKRVDPTAMNLLLRLADCYERLGRTASAWSEYAEAAAIARASSDPRAETAAQHASALAARLAKLVVVVPPERRVPGLEVRRDGALVPEGRWGEAIPVDPGEHVVEVSAPGRLPARLTAPIDAAGGTKQVTIPELARGRNEAASAAPAAAPSGSRQRLVSIALGSAGLAGAAVGTVLGLRAMSLRDESNDGHCDAKSYCDAAGLTLRDDAQAAGTGSTVAFALSATALAAGAALWLTAPSTPNAPRVVGPQPVGLAWPGGAVIGARGTF